MKIQICYDHKTACGNWLPYDYIIRDGADYDRVSKILTDQKDDYIIRMVNVLEI